MPRTPITRSGVVRLLAVATTARRGSGAWLVALLPLLAAAECSCCGRRGRRPGWAMLGMVAPSAIAVAGSEPCCGASTARYPR